MTSHHISSASKGAAPPAWARAASVCAIALIAQLIASTPTHCQVSEGDEQFEFQHQDIGRISGLSSGSSQVAAQTTIVSRPQQQHQHQHQPQVFGGAENQAAPTSPLPPAVAQVFERGPAAPAAHSAQGGSHPRAAHRKPPTGSQRKPNRITLVARRDPAPAPSQPLASGLVAAQLPAPTSAASLAELPQPTFAPLALANHQNQQQAQVSGDAALNSFRTTGDSVSARHSALIAQVAAERAAAAAPGQIEPAALSFGSPAAALSSPQAVAVSAAQQPARQQLHQSQLASRLQQPAFASFLQQQQQQQQHRQEAGAALVQHLSPVAAPSQPAALVDRPEEPLVAPSFEQVLGQGCPQKGVFSWENRDHCDRYYMCTNGTFTEEACPNGLAYSQQGAVYQHCAYNWNVNCGAKKSAEPIASPGCPWQFGIFPILQAGRCSIDYFVCEWGVPDTKRCSPEGLFYDDRIKGCQWADQLGCKSESLLNFKCPPEDEDNQFWPFPRYYHSTKDVIVCVNEQPRLVHCTEEQVVDSSSLACMEINKKKQKF